MDKSHHPGLVAAVALAGGVVALGKMVGRHHNYITYRMTHGRGLPEDMAILVGQKLGLKASTLADNGKAKP